jgi:hypothetical protein
MKKRRAITPRATLMRWLEADPGMKTCEVALRCGQPAAYVGDRLRNLQQRGFLLSESLPDTAGGRPRLCWFVNPKHPPMVRKPRPSLAECADQRAVIAPREYGVGQQLARVCRAPNSDSSIVAMALARQPDLQAAWMGRAL